MTTGVNTVGECGPMGGKHTGKERREERLPCKGVLITYMRNTMWSTLGFKKKSSKPCPVRNITRSGICFLSRDQLKVGETLLLALQFGEHKPTISVEAKVMWCGQGEGIYPYKVGMGFYNVAGHSWEVLSKVEQYVLKKEAWQAWRLRAEEQAAKMWGSSDK
jgi:Tfp pilus assembly protein PilZ